MQPRELAHSPHLVPQEGDLEIAQAARTRGQGDGSVVAPHVSGRRASDSAAPGLSCEIRTARQEMFRNSHFRRAQYRWRKQLTT